VGELAQMDGSFHDWLEERGPRGGLMNMVDDARGDTLARMGSEETIWAAAASVASMDQEIRGSGGAVNRLEEHGFSPLGLSPAAKLMSVDI